MTQSNHLKQHPYHSVATTKVHHVGRQIILPVLFVYALLFDPVFAEESVDAYLDLDLEDLLSMEVTSVSKKKQRLTEAAAAVFVITQEDILRSGVISIPEALRMAPGVQVAKIDRNKWAISSRGFNTQFANKLLVLIDGRTVYTPSYSGVYWDIQDTLLEDIDRIEVIRGPGATLWGANAVNGVINIITKQAADTQEGLLVVGMGNEEKALASVRYGIDLGDATHARAYLKYNDRNSSFAPSLEQEAGDDWQTLRAGFRVDGELDMSDRWTVQGDIYRADENQTVKQSWLGSGDPANISPGMESSNRDLYIPDNFDASGWNLLGRWQRHLSENTSATLQLYFDHTDRNEAVLGQTHDTLDIDFQHQFRPLERHDMVWGLGFRRITDEFENSLQVAFLPDQRTSNLFSAFIQDEIELSQEKLRLTLGSKFEHNDYTGFEIQPNARLLWRPQEGHTFWTSVSRAVRTPSRLEDSTVITTGFIPPPPPPLAPPGTPPTRMSVNGSEHFMSEELIAFELGYRLQPTESLSLDLALFHNRYKDLQDFETVDDLTLPDPSDPLGPPIRLPTTLNFANHQDGTSQGLELAMDWRLREWWRLQAYYAYLDVSADTKVASSDEATAALVEGSSPKHQLSIRSAMDLSNAWSLDLWVYYVDELARTSLSNPLMIPDYTSLNVRLAWHPRPDLELSLLGQNLLDKRHLEFAGENFVTTTEVERSVYGKIRWEF